VSRSHITKWLYVGLHVKRWLAIMLLGVVLMGLGIAYLLREVYVSYSFPAWVGTLTLQDIPRWARGLIFIALASGLTVFGSWKLNRSILSAVLPPDRQGEVVERIYQHRTRGRGPRIVAIGGGTGLSLLLRGLKTYTSNLTAIVTVADDGGSSGLLRKDLGVIPPGDIRACIAALADAEPLVTELFQYRFDESAGERIAGHSFGNLFIVAMSGVTGSMEEAIRETSRVLAVRGRILPSTLADVRLRARLVDGSIVEGESKIPGAGLAVDRVEILPGDVPAHAEATAALARAELIVLGPGSLFTSVLPNLLVPGIREALLGSPAHTVYVANVATQHGETDGFSAADHFAAIRRHLDSDDVADVVLANSNLPGEPLPEEWHSQPVAAPGDGNYGSARLELADLVDHERRYRHDAERIAAAVMRSYFERDLRRKALGEAAVAHPGAPA
jgi:uncharacterized cofD-like protein